MATPTRRGLYMMGWSWDRRELDIPFHFYNISGAEEAWFRFTNYERRLDVEVLSHWDGEELPLGEAIEPQSREATRLPTG